MNKKFFFIAMSTILLVIINSTFAQVNVNINAPNRVTLGEVFTAHVEVSEVTALDTASFTLTYDATVIQVLDVAAGDLMTGANLITNTTVLGEIRTVLNLPDVGGVDGSGAIADIEFQAIKVVSFSDLKLSAVLLGNTLAEPIPVVVGQPARVNVIGESPDVVIVSIISPAEVMEDEKFTVTVEVTEVTNLDAAFFTLTYVPTVLQVVNVTAGSLTDGAELTFNPTIPGQLKVALNMPDVGGVSGFGAIAEIEFQAIGIVSSNSDLKLLEVALSNKDAQSIPSSIGQPMTVSIIGDPPKPAYIRLTAPDAVRPGDSFTAYVEASQVTDLDTIFFTLIFEPEVLRVVNVTPGLLTASAKPIFNSLPSGQANAVLNLPDLGGVSGSGTIASIELQAIGTVGSFSKLTLSGMLLGNTVARAIPVVFIEQTAVVNITGDAPPQVIVSIAAPSLVDVNSNFDVGIEVTQVNNLDTALFVLKFNPTVLEVVSVIAGNLTAGTPPTFNDTISGQVTVLINIPGFDGVSGEGSIAIVKFHAIGAVGSSSALELSSVQLGNTSGKLIPCVPGPPVLVWVGMVGYGDVSGNGTVSPLDAAMVIKATIGMIELTPIQFEKADVSDDGKVTGYDAALIMKYIAGLISEFPAGMGVMITFDE